MFIGFLADHDFVTFTNNFMISENRNAKNVPFFFDSYCRSLTLHSLPIVFCSKLSDAA